MADSESIEIIAGTTWTDGLELYTDDANTLPFDLTGYTVRGVLRSSPADTGTALTCTVTDEEGGKVTLALTATQTAALFADATDFSDTKEMVMAVEISKNGVVTEVDRQTVIIVPEVVV